jgi:hypothetical protein
MWGHIKPALENLSGTEELPASSGEGIVDRSREHVLLSALKKTQLR